MDKLIKVGFTLLLVASIAAPGSFATAKTIEDVPTTESSILSRTADPTTVSKQRLELEKLEESDGEKEESTKETNTIESSERTDKELSTKDSTTETINSSKERTEKKSPRATFLREGVYGVNDPDTYDIDATLSYHLRRINNNNLSNNSFTGRFKAEGTLTKEDMETLTFYDFPYIYQGGIQLKSLKGLEYAVNLELLGLDGNPSLKSSEVPLNTFSNLKTLKLINLPEFTDLDTSNLPNLESLEIKTVPIDEIDVSTNQNLETLNIDSTQIKEIDISTNQNLKVFRSANNLLNAYEIFDTSRNKDLESLTMVHSSGLNIKKFDFSLNSKLTKIFLQRTGTSEIEFPEVNIIREISISENNFEELDFSSFSELVAVDIFRNYKLKKLDLSNANKLQRVQVNYNNIGDITSTYGKQELKILNYSNQEILVPVRVVNGEAEIDVLKTTSKKGLSVTKGTVLGSPSINVIGDKINLKNITASNIDGKYLNFNYDTNNILEGVNPPIPGLTLKQFNGKLNLYTISDISSEIKAKNKKVSSGEIIEWTWNVKSTSDASALEVFPKLDLPTGLSLVSGSVKINGVSVNDSALDGSTNIGTIGENDEKIITFETTVSGNAEEWLKATATLNWKDNGPDSPYELISEDSVQIKDDEQTYTPEPSEEMGLLSVPIRFDYGIKDMSSTAQTFSLSPDLYQTNTNVVNNGFYTRVKDDRTTSTGWSLTAQLSSFVNVTDTSSGMPDSYGTALRFEDLSIEGVKDRDTPQESIDPGAAGAPTLVNTSEKIVAGDSAKTLVSAEPYEGQGTWQLRIPFDKVFLDLPAYAGKERTNFQAKLTWSLNDTPTP